MSERRDPLPYIQDILDAVARIDRYVKGMDLQRFLADEVVQDAVVRRIEVIGEAVGRLPEVVKEQYSDIPWRDIKDMRNKLAHDYGQVDFELVWGVVHKELPALREQIRRIVTDLSD